nr:MAG TPA: portal [Bacteriophage sp.]
MIKTPYFLYVNKAFFMAKMHIKLKIPRVGTIAPTSEQMTMQMAVSSRFGLGTIGWLPNPDPILRKMGRQIDVYRELVRDPIVGGQIRRRKSAVCRLNWKLDRKNDFIQSALEKLDIPLIINNILDAPMFGYAPLEVIWRTDKNAWLPEKIIAKPQEWFRFDEDGKMYLIEYNKNIHWDFSGSTPLPDYKFLCPKHEASYLNPYGLGDLGLVFWAVTFKRAGLKFWAQFTEKYGSPWLIGKEPRSNTQVDTDKLLDALEALAGTAVGTIPNDSSVEIHEATNKTGSVDAYDKLIRYCRSEINIALLGQDQTTEANSNRASATAGLEVTSDIRDGDCRIVESTFNQLIQWIGELNFGENFDAPKFVLYDAPKAGDYELAQRDQLLSQMGAQFSTDYFIRAYGLEKGDLTVSGSLKVENTEKTANFAEKKQPENTVNDADLYDLTDKIAPFAPSNFAQMWRKMVENLPENPEELLGEMADWYPKMQSSELEEMLTHVIFLSEILGRLQAESENE